MAAATAEGAFDDLDDLDDWEAGDWTWDAPSDEDGRHPPHHHGQASRPEQPATATPARDTAEGRTAASDEDHDRTLDGRLALNPYKAGLQSADKERVNKIIYEASKGSRFFKREEQRNQVVSEKAAKLKAEYAAFLKQDQTAAARYVDGLVQQLEAQRDLTRTIVHIDMDAFYASVEEKYNPELRGKPIAVGGMAMLSTANYEARKYGVRSAMPGFIGKKLCPDLILVPANFERYTSESNIVREVLAMYDPNYSAASLDEAYLDITDALARHPEHTAETMVQELRAEIFRRTQLTSSAGIACNKMLAKICTDINKPNGQYRLPPDRDAIRAFVEALPIRKIPGVGKVTERLLAELGFTMAGHLFANRVALYVLFLRSTFEFLLHASMGISSTALRTFRSGWVRKSLGHERTFSELSHPVDLQAKCRELSNAVAEELEEHRLLGRTVTVKLKSVDFSVITRASSLRKPTNAADDIYDAAWAPKQMIEANLPLRLRLMGVRMTALQSMDERKGGITKYLRPANDAPVAELAHAPPAGGDDVQDAQCPVCNRALGRVSNTALNRHIDECLNRGALADDPEPKTGQKRPPPAEQHRPSPARRAAGPPTDARGTATPPSRTLKDFFRPPPAAPSS